MCFVLLVIVRLAERIAKNIGTSAEYPSIVNSESDEETAPILAAEISYDCKW